MTAVLGVSLLLLFLLLVLHRINQALDVLGALTTKGNQLMQEVEAIQAAQAKILAAIDRGILEMRDQFAQIPTLDDKAALQQIADTLTAKADALHQVITDVDTNQSSPAPGAGDDGGEGEGGTPTE